jgi:hypothetical protein
MKEHKMTFLNSLKNAIGKQAFRNLIIKLILATFCAASANANLIENGGFEQDSTGSSYGGGRGWNYYDSSDVPG